MNVGWFWTWYTRICVIAILAFFAVAIYHGYEWLVSP